MAAALDIVIRRVSVEHLVDLRHAELRRGRPRESARFPGDDHPETRHYAAVLRVPARAAGAGVVGCASFVRAPLASAWSEAPAMQLRGMATRAELQGRGVGRALLTVAVDELRASGETRLWCNARVGAIGFYEAMGWRVISEPFDVPEIGPHVQMIATEPTLSDAVEESDPA